MLENRELDRLEQIANIGKVEFTSVSEAVITVAQAVQKQGGRALLVGGCVRDMAIGKKPKDFDIEVYGLQPDHLEKIVQVFGKVSAVGKAFGILKLNLGEDMDLDLSLPRTDSKVGVGHRGFEVKTDPFMSIEEAAKRRDFTLNSMLLDPLTGELFDPYGGYMDLRAGILKVTDRERFADDPLRVMRALQFVGRFHLSVDEESMRVMREMVPYLRELPKERFLEEWKKLLLKSKQPSQGLQVGMELGIFDILHPEFRELESTPQDPLWHAEGNVWIHTKMVVDQASQIATREQLDDSQSLVILFAALCHDLGKPLVTDLDERGRVIAHGHEKAGVAVVKQFLKSLGVDNLTTEKVLKLVEHHMWLHQNFSAVERGQVVSDGALLRLAQRLYPATINELVLLSEADQKGRKDFSYPQLPEQFPAGQWLQERAFTMGVAEGKPKDVLQGRDLLELGYLPGKHFGEIIKLANVLRDEYGFTREELLRQISSFKDPKFAITHLQLIASKA